MSDILTEIKGLKEITARGYADLVDKHIDRIADPEVFVHLLEYGLACANLTQTELLKVLQTTHVSVGDQKVYLFKDLAITTITRWRKQSRNPPTTNSIAAIAILRNYITSAAIQTGTAP